VREPSDGERLDALLRLLALGFERHLLLSHDVCTKMQLRRYGGMGYDHILRTIVPRLRRRGVDSATLHRLLVENPARLLSGTDVTAPLRPHV
jgi:phosphotriesterase-related protein